MEMIFKATGVLCITAYITGILANFMPTDYTQKAVRLTIAIYILTSVFIPATEEKIDINFPSVQIKDYADQAEEYIISRAEDEIENNISQSLNEKKISYNLVDVHIYKQSESLQIEDIYIYGVPTEQKSIVLETLPQGNNIIFGD